MTAGIQQQEALTAVLSRRWEQVCRKAAALTEAIPADQFNSRPKEGIRTCGEVLRHVAFWNQYVADTLNGKQADDVTNELPAARYSTKVSILEAFQRTSADVSLALRQHAGPLDLKATELVMTFVEHTSEHYGQLAVYARLMGIVPASRT